VSQFILRYANAPLLILMVLLGVGIQTSFFSFYPLNYLQPDIILLIVIWMSFKRPFIEGGILTLIFSEIAEVHTSGIRGIFFITYMSIYLLIKLFNKMLIFQSYQSLIGLTLFVSLFWKLESLLLIYFLNYGANQWQHTLALLLPGALMEGALGIWVYRWLEKLDWITFKDPRARDALNEDTILTEEGF